MKKTIKPITRKEFEAYEAVRKTGNYNMLTEAGAAAAAAGLTLKRYVEVLQNYTACVTRWSEVRK